jgi:hypothetical protein
MMSARGEPRPKAEARNERTLEGVGCSAWFGVDSAMAYMVLLRQRPVVIPLLPVRSRHGDH